MIKKAEADMAEFLHLKRLMIIQETGKKEDTGENYKKTSKMRQIFWAKVKNRLFGWDYVIVNHRDSLINYFVVTRVMKDAQGECFIINNGIGFYLKEMDDVIYLTKNKQER